MAGSQLPVAARFPPPAKSSSPPAPARVARLLPAWLRPAHFLRLDEWLKTPLVPESWNATQSVRCASTNPSAPVRLPAKSVHRTFPASGESGRGNVREVRRIQAPRRGRRRLLEKQLLPRRSWPRNPGQKKMEFFPMAAGATWRAEKTLVPRGRASFRRLPGEVPRRRGSGAVFEVVSGARSSKSWEGALGEF